MDGTSTGTTYGAAASAPATRCPVAGAVPVASDESDPPGTCPACSRFRLGEMGRAAHATASTDRHTDRGTFACSQGRNWAVRTCQSAKLLHDLAGPAR